MTCEWIDGVKFDNKESLEKNGFNVGQLMSTMVKLFADVLHFDQINASKYSELDLSMPM